MKIQRVLNNYPELKEAGAVSLRKGTDNRVFIIANKYDQYTGKVAGRKTIEVDEDKITEEIKTLQTRIDQLKELRKDIRKAEKAEVKRAKPENK